MYKRCWILLYGIFYIGVIDFALSQQKQPDKSVNLALETVFEFDNDGKSDIRLLNNVQKFIGKVKNVLQQKHIERRQTGTDERNVFTNFILNIVNVLNGFKDNDLERFFDIINNEIQRYCDKDDDFHILNKLRLVDNMPAYVLRRYLNAISNKIEEEAYLKDEKVVLDGVNDIFKRDDTIKFDTLINNLENYGRKSRRNVDLAQVIKLGLRNIFLHSYHNMKPSTKTALRSILHHYFGGTLPPTTKYPIFQQSNSIKRAKSKTTREFKTWRQMYVEKNLDLKYPTDAIPVVTKKHKRKDKLRTQKSRIMTVPTTRVTKESHYIKGKKYGRVIEYDRSPDTSKHTDNSDEQSNSDAETIIVKTTKMFYENDYKRDINQKYGKQSNEYKNSKEYDEDEEKYRAEHRKLNKLSTFYLDFEKLSASSYVQQRLDTTTHEYERPVKRPIGFTISIKNGKHWNSRQKVKKSKHYGYIEKKRKDVFSNERQMRMKKKGPTKIRMPPISLNMQISMTKKPSTLNNGVADTYMHRNEDVRTPLSEEGLSIEGFQETIGKINNRRSENHNDTANNHILNLIQKIEQDLEAVKSKIHNTSVLKNVNNLDNIIKVIENDVNKNKGTINKDQSLNQAVINVRKFYEERSRYDVDNIKQNFSFPDEKITFKSRGVNKEEPINMGARKTIYDQELYPVVRAREADSDEIIIKRKYAPLEKTLPKPVEHDFEVNFSEMDNNIPISKDSPTKNEVNESLMNESNSNTTLHYLNEKAKNYNLDNTTSSKVSSNTKVNESDIYINNDSKDKTFDHNKGTIKDIKVIYRATIQNILIEPNKINLRPKFRSHKDKINNTVNVTLKEITTTKSDNKTTSVNNYKNTTESVVTVNNFITTQKVTDVSLNENKLKKPVVNEIDRRLVITTAKIR